MCVRSRVFAFGLAAAFGAAALAGCSAGNRTPADKAGGGAPPTAVLRLAYVDWTDNGADAQLLQDFAAKVASRSGGRLRVDIINTDYKAPDEELAVARAVRSGQFDLGWITTRRWNDLGVRSFQALQAPFLITGYGTTDAVARSPIAQRMLKGVGRYGVTGLALVPRELLHPEAPRPLLAPRDYAGLQFLVARSRTTDELLARFGAKAVYTIGSVTAGAPASVQPLRESSGVETANVVLSPRFGTLFVSRRALARLSSNQQAALRSASADMIDEAIAGTPPEREAARVHCQTGLLALAGPSDLAALEAAASPVTAELEHDRETRKLIAAIRKLEATTRAERPFALPAGCAERSP
jgi:TRAP-type C4-dicarboxylate transport system substrate-binding protein